MNHPSAFEGTEHDVTSHVWCRPSFPQRCMHTWTVSPWKQNPSSSQGFCQGLLTEWRGFSVLGLQPPPGPRYEHGVLQILSHKVKYSKSNAAPAQPLPTPHVHELMGIEGKIKDHGWVGLSWQKLGLKNTSCLKPWDQRKTST